MENTTETKTDIKEYVNLCRVKKGNITHTEIAKRMNTTPQNLFIKYRRNSFRICDLENIADALNADLSIVFIDRETGEPIVEGTSYTKKSSIETTNEESITHEQVHGGIEDEPIKDTTQESVTEQQTENPTVQTQQTDQIAPSFYHNNNN